MARPRTEVAEYTGLVLRLPEPIHKAFKRLAIKQRRSLNAQLLCALEDWLHEQEKKHDLVNSRNN